VADTAAERISKSAAAPHAEREQVRTEKRIDGQRSGTALAFSAVAPWERPGLAAHLILCILNGALSGLFRR
jgi:hypothetical protein